MTRCFVCHEATVAFEDGWYCGDCDLVSGSDGEAGPDQPS